GLRLATDVSFWYQKDTTTALERYDEGGNHGARGQCPAPRDGARPLAAPHGCSATAACAHDLGDGGGTALHPRGCPAPRLRPRSGLSWRISLYARGLSLDVSWTAVDLS